MKEKVVCTCSDLRVIGRTAEVVLAGYEPITAKVDTGAYTGGMHVEDVRVEDNKLHFKPFTKDNTEVVISDFRTKGVKSSSGEWSERYVVSLPAVIDGFEAIIEVTLANRAEMSYEMLLGRKNLANKFIVDVTK